MVNTQVQETMLLLAEALTVDFQVDEALDLYKQILDSREQSSESTKEINRAIAPLYTQQGKFVEAANCLQKVLNDEEQELAKVGIYTKIAGNYKKADSKDECVEASQAAYDLIRKLQGERDLQTCKCLLNLGQVQQHFENNEEATKIF